MFGNWLMIQESRSHEAVFKEIFQEICYPLISEVDLVNLVRSLKIAGSDIYAAALEYYLAPEK